MDRTNAFVAKYTTRIAFTLDCFDRVIFKGHLRPLCFPAGLRRFVDFRLGIRRKDFMPWAKAQSRRIVEHAQALAARHNRPYLYLNGMLRKERIVAELLRRHPVHQGLVCVLRCIEHCPSFRLIHAQRRPDFAPARPPALVFCFYWLDADLGLIHVRVPTLCPWPIQVAVNGHDYLARQLLAAGIGLVQEDNALVELDDPARAQKRADRFLRENWPGRLRRPARTVLPSLTRNLHSLRNDGKRV